MVDSEIKETTMIIVSAILISAVLGFASYLFMLRTDFAGVRNAEVYAAASMQSYREFNNFNGGEVLYGEDVVVAVRDYFEAGVRIRVNNSDGSNQTYTKASARENPASVDIKALQALYPTTNKYTSVLVYGDEDLDTITKDYISPSSMNTNVSAIVFFYDGPR